MKSSWIKVETLDMRRLIAFVCFLPGAAGLHYATAQENQSLPEPGGFHLLLRLAGDKKNYKLGELIQVEAGCYADEAQRYLSSCAAPADNPPLNWIGLEVTPVGEGARIAADQVETHWIERAFCASKVENIDFPNYPAHPPVGKEMQWQKMTVTEHYPMSAGHFQIRALTWMGSGPPIIVRSAPVEINVIDDPRWRAALFREVQDKFANMTSGSEIAVNEELSKLTYLPDPEVFRWLVLKADRPYWADDYYPDRAFVAKVLREYLNENAEDYDGVNRIVHTVLASELAAESPSLYKRASVFGDALGNPSPRDLRDLRAWLVPRYRRIMLDLADSMVANYNRGARNDERTDLEYTIQKRAEALVRLNVPECGFAKPFLSASELRRFMHDAGLSQQFINEQISTILTTRFR